ACYSIVAYAPSALHPTSPTALSDLSVLPSPPFFEPLLFFFNDTATTEIYTLSLHDALPICTPARSRRIRCGRSTRPPATPPPWRSEEHTSELQSLTNLVCRLLLEKKKKAGATHNLALSRTDPVWQTRRRACHTPMT